MADSSERHSCPFHSVLVFCNSAWSRCDQTVRMAQACDRAGFDIFWLAEAYPWWRKHGFEARSSTAITAVVATQTKRITIGWGIISPVHASSGADRDGSARACRTPRAMAAFCLGSARRRSS